MAERSNHETRPGTPENGAPGLYHVILKNRPHSSQGSRNTTPKITFPSKKDGFGISFISQVLNLCGNPHKFRDSSAVYRNCARSSSALFPDKSPGAISNTVRAPVSPVFAKRYAARA